MSVLKSLAAAVVVAVVSGCASVPMEAPEATEAARQFKAPADGQAGLYIYRSGSFGGALKKDVWVNGECIGETAPNVFFYHEVPGDQAVKVSTESEFSPNDLLVQVKAGLNYFIRQYMKIGVFVGGAGLEQVDEAAGKEAIRELNLATKGTCSQ